MRLPADDAVVFGVGSDPEPEHPILYLVKSRPVQGLYAAFRCWADIDRATRILDPLPALHHLFGVLECEAPDRRINLGCRARP